jgi:hypothetical protein
MIEGGDSLAAAPSVFFCALYIVLVFAWKLETLNFTPPRGGAHHFGKKYFCKHFFKNGWATLRLNVVLISEDGAADCERQKHRNP